jgi:hypothetical protein
MNTIESKKFVEVTSHMSGHKIIVNDKELSNHMESMIASILSDSKEIDSPNALGLSDCILNPKKCLADAIKFGANVIERIKESIEIISAKEIESVDSISSSTSSYEYFGKSIVSGDFNGDGIKDLAIGAPGFSKINDVPSKYVESRVGRVYMYFGTNDSDNPYKIMHLDGIEDGSRFGWSLLSIDFNKDGIDDLIVSAPSGSSRYDDGGYPHAHYRGSAYVYFGKASSIFDSKQNPDLVIVGKDVDEIAAFGFSMRAFDIDNDGFADLVLGSPFAYGGSGKSGQEGGDPDPYTERKVIY